MEGGGEETLADKEKEKSVKDARLSSDISRSLVASEMPGVSRPTPASVIFWHTLCPNNYTAESPCMREISEPDTHLLSCPVRNKDFFPSGKTAEP